MKWLGKVVGGTLGFMMGGPVGSAAGALLGHGVDAGLLLSSIRLRGGWSEEHERVQSAFFTAAYSVMGYMSKADGRVSQYEISVVEGVIARMGLSPEMRKAAIDLFNQGKSEAFPLEQVIHDLNAACQRKRMLKLMLIEMLLQVAYADGAPGEAEQALLTQIRRRLGISRVSFDHIERLVGLQQQHARHGDSQGYSRRSEGGRRSRAADLNHAYSVLGVSPRATDSEVKLAYRKLLSRHHPDKLVAQQVPDEMMRLAAEKTHEIRSSYEMVIKARAA